MILATVLLAILVIVFLTIIAVNKFSRFNFEAEVERTERPVKRQGWIMEAKTQIGTVGMKKIFVEDSARHCAIFGTTGSGKTVVLANFVKSAIEKNYPALIIDGKGDTNEGSLYDVVKKMAADKGRKVYILDLNDPKHSDKYNPFKNTSPTVIKDMLINLTEWSEEHYKSNTEWYLQRLIDLLSKAGIPTSLKNIIANMPAKKFVAISAELVKRDVITKADHTDNIELSEKTEKIVNGAAARFATLYESEVGQIFADEGIDIYTALKERAVILVVLNPLLYPEITPLFANLVIIDSKKAVSNLFKNKVGRTFFFFDEAGVFASNTLLDLINKSRVADVTCLLATQTPSDYDARVSDAFTEQVFENCNNYIILRQNSSKNAERVAGLVGTYRTMDLTYQIDAEGSTGLGSAKTTREYFYHPDDIKNLKTGEAIYASKDNGFHTKLKVTKCF
jgi:type IV secretory pathway TraG/TraD family ATPase VirD4